MIPLAIPNLQGNEAAYLQECISSTFVSTVGPFVTQFEEQIAQLSGTPSSAVLCSGTTALHMALEGLGVGAGDLVMLPSLTFIASPNSVMHSGADIWLIDVKAENWCLDIDQAREAIENQTLPHQHGRLHKESGKLLKAIMPVMIMGSVPDLEGITALASEYGLKVIVDAAAAIGTKGKDGIPIGQTGVDAVCFSFNGNKTITCGGGGAVTSSDPGLINRIKHLSSTGRVGSNYDHDVVAYNYRMTNVQAALGVAQLERLSEFLKVKQYIRDRYAALSSQLKDLSPFPDPEFGTNGHWFSGMWYTGKNLRLAEDFRDHMRASGIDLRPFWKPIHLQAPYINAVSESQTISEDLWKRIFPLPCSTHISSADLEAVTSAAKQFWKTAENKS